MREAMRPPDHGASADNGDTGMLRSAQNARTTTSAAQAARCETRKAGIAGLPTAWATP